MMNADDGGFDIEIVLTRVRPALRAKVLLSVWVTSLALLGCDGLFQDLGELKAPESGDDDVELVVEPETIVFSPQLEAGESAEETLTISNAGSGELRVSNLEFSDETDDAFGEDPGWPEGDISLGGGQSQSLVVHFEMPDDREELEGALLMDSNDPDRASVEVELTVSDGLSGPVIEVEPESVVFTGAPDGEGSAQQSVQFHNRGDAPLQVWDVEFTESSAPVFVKGVNWPENEITVESGETYEFDVRFEGDGSDTEYDGEIRWESNDPDAPDGLPIEVDSAPRAEVTPQILVFPNTPVDSRDEQGVKIRNVGAESMTLDVIISSGSEEFSIAFYDDPTSDPADDELAPPDVLEVGESVYMRVTYTPASDEPAFGEIEITTNDPTQETIVVELSGNVDVPCLDVINATAIYFGPSPMGETSYDTVILANCSPGNDVDVEQIDVSDDGGGVFSVSDEALPGDLSSGDALTLAPGDVAIAQVGYTPEDDGIHEGELRIRSSDGIIPERYVSMIGEGVDASCPVAEVGGSIGSPSAPESNPVSASNQDIVYLSSEGSSAPEGAELGYEWSVIERPLGSTTDIDAPTISDPTFEIDIVGDYQIELVVYTETGMVNCEPAILKITATHGGDVHIELTWEAPQVDAVGGPDPTENRGTDLDLHYVRPGGQWGDSDDSVYWREKQQDWNDDGQDNVVMDLDSDLGDYPENITHTDLESGDHRVGVHYYDDMGWGPSDARVRVYAGGTLVAERERRLDHTDNFWHVGAVTQLGSSFSIDDDFETTFPLLFSADDN